MLVPPGEVGSLVVYYHGGGWVIGNIDEYDTLGRQLATRLGATVTDPAMDTPYGRLAGLTDPTGTYFKLIG